MNKSQKLKYGQVAMRCARTRKEMYSVGSWEYYDEMAELRKENDAGSQGRLCKETPDCLREQDRLFGKCENKPRMLVQWELRSEVKRNRKEIKGGRQHS